MNSTLWKLLRPGLTVNLHFCEWMWTGIPYCAVAVAVANTEQYTSIVPEIQMWCRSKPILLLSPFPKCPHTQSQWKWNKRQHAYNIYEKSQRYCVHFECVDIKRCVTQSQRISTVDIIKTMRIKMCIVVSYCSMCCYEFQRFEENRREKL